VLQLGHPAPQFGVSFPEKLLKIVATRDEIISLKFTKYRLAAGLRPDPLGKLKRSPDPLYTCNNGTTSKGRELGKRRGGTVATSLQYVFHAIVMTKQFVCTEVCYQSATQLPSFVSFAEKLLKIVANRGEIFSLKFTKCRLAYGLRPNPLGKLKRSPRPPTCNNGPTSKGRELGKGRNRCHILAIRLPCHCDD